VEWIHVMDPGGSIRSILVDLHDGSWWIHVMDPGGSTWFDIASYGSKLFVFR